MQGSSSVNDPKRCCPSVKSLQKIIETSKMKKNKQTSKMHVKIRR